MNNRIRKLAGQAGYAPMEPRAFADDLQDIFLQKFAELIVRECAGIYEAIDHGNKIEGTDCYPDAIHKYFGVEK